MIEVYVTIELCQGNIAEVRAFWNEHMADLAHKRWLKNHNIQSQTDRDGKAQNGTEFFIYTCTLNE